MTTEVHWQAIALRLILTVVAGALLGAERSRSGHPAGLRTTLLVALAASVSMIQMNLLMPTDGKPPDSYVVMDVMRLPLGILTGVGFIGAGAIVRKNELVLGITTAATMWYATVIGLCIGGGQILLGMTGAAIGFLVLWALRLGEQRMDREHRGVLTLTVRDDRVSLNEVKRMLESERLEIKSSSTSYAVAERCSMLRFEIRWRSRQDPSQVPEAIPRLKDLAGVTEYSWSSTGS